MPTTGGWFLYDANFDRYWVACNAHNHALPSVTSQFEILPYFSSFNHLKKKWKNSKISDKQGVGGFIISYNK